MAEDMSKELSSYIDARYVEAHGGSLRAAIKAVPREEVGQKKERKRVLYLAGHDIGLPLNKINQRYLVGKLGGDPDAMVGKQIELFLADTQNPQGVPCKGVRVKLAK